ncbi:MAG: DNA polymerase III subunit gamma and tau [Marmoricola sp.]
MEHLALYRRYRPETFAEVIGQDHVTAPLRQALANDRVNHAYLFSGPRGCGKTTSARILARALNCEKAPVAEPCGECRSCVDLARGGPGSIDVIEIDAASHGGVDDARDLRERAFFAPVHSRFKVYIIDEAHMVSSQGFNALLKLVEEPPEHLKFIFATTEPEKVIPTIRSRTHHYPFRLIPPKALSDYLAELCAKEGVPIDPAALPLVVRAGAGSARDSLSVLDQLLGGAGDGGVTYDIATQLLGYTPDNLLDEVVDGFAAGDGSAVFGVVDKVIETGQDPRRFTEDLLRRLRDLVVVAAVPDAPSTGLIDAPEDQGERLLAQAARFGSAELVRAAETVASGLTEMRGATTPRLLLELLCARVLLPAVDDGVDGLAARLDRVERRLQVAGSGTAQQAAPAREPALESAPGATPRPAVEQVEEDSTPAPPAPTSAPESGPVPTQHQPAPAAAPPAPAAVPHSAAPSSPAPSSPASTPAPPPGSLSLGDVRRMWPDLLEAVKKRRRFTWILLSQNAQVIGFDGSVLTVGLKNAGARESFVGGGSDEVLREAVREHVGGDWRVEAVVDPSADPDAGAPRVTRPAVAETPVDDVAPRGTPAAPAQPEPDAASAPDWARPEADSVPAPATGGVRPESLAQARSNIAPTRHGDEPATAVREAAERDADAHRDDPDVLDDGLDGKALLERELGAVVIDEITTE